MVAGVLAIGLLLVVFMGATSFSLDEYAKGAVRTAVDEAAQAGAVAGGSLGTCQQQAALVIGSLLHGSLGDDVKVVCTQVGTEILARGSGALPTLVPGLPTVNISVVGVAVVEGLQQQ